MWCHLISILYRICHVYQQWQVLPRQPGIILGFSLNWRWQVLSFLFFSFLAGACTGSCFRAAMMCWWVSGKLHHSDSLWQGFVTVQSTILKAKQKQQKCCQRQLVPQNWHYTDVMCCWKLCKGETTKKSYWAETCESQNCGFRLQQQNYLAMTDDVMAILADLLTSLMQMLRATCSGGTRSAVMSQKA